jgi:hypothetical protein
MSYISNQFTACLASARFVTAAAGIAINSNGRYAYVAQNNELLARAGSSSLMTCQINDDGSLSSCNATVIPVVGINAVAVS